MPQTQLSPQLFTDSVAPFMKFLTEKFKDKPLCVSDVRDEFGKQYVDLVQEGGGVHGVALAGYTYVLEKMGIGFMKMAGTSAGSINTLLLNAVYTKEEAAALGVTGKYYETRSEKVLEYLANKPLTDMVDGHPAWRKLLLKMFTGTVGVSGLVKTAKHIKRRIILALIAFAVLVLCTVGMATGLGGNAMETAYKWGIIVTVGGLLVLAALLYLRVRFIKFLYKHAEHLGINPGKDFEQWIEKDILKNNGIATVADLKAKLDREEKVLQYRYDACFPTSTQVSAVDTIQGFDEVLNKIKNPKVKIDDLFDHLSDFLSGQGEGFASSPLLMEPIMQAFEQRLKAEDKGVTKELVIVSSDITHEIKVEFPGMHKMYWGDDYSISPAKYVRASMSVPFFFKPFQIDFAKEQEAVIKNEWWQYMKVQKNLETCALLVDGGMLSNFPINVFYNQRLVLNSSTKMKPCRKKLNH
jgi:NTE family protein